MAQKIIKYIPKHTQSGTAYREIQEQDLEWILQQCIRALALMSEYDRISSTNDTDSVWIRDQWWHRRRKDLHRGRDGMNSPCSVMGGIVSNFMFKEPRQRDLSDKQMQDIENIFNAMSNFTDHIQALRFQIGFAE